MCVYVCMYVCIYVCVCVSTVLCVVFFCCVCALCVRDVLAAQRVQSCLFLLTSTYEQTNRPLNGMGKLLAL